MAVLAERNLGRTSAGESVLSVALLRDIAAIPVLALVPLFAVGGSATAAEGSAWLAAGKAVAAIVTIVFGGRLLLRPCAALDCAQPHARDLYRRRAAAGAVHGGADAVRGPFNGARRLPGRCAAGRASTAASWRPTWNPSGPAARPLLHRRRHGPGPECRGRPAGAVLAVLVALLVGKTLVLVLMARAMKLPVAERPAFVILLAQGGEFGFVVFQLGEANGVLTGSQNSALVAAVAISLAVTPLLLTLAERWTTRRMAAQGTRGSLTSPAAARAHPDCRQWPLWPGRGPACCTPAACKRPCWTTTPRPSRACASSASRSTTVMRQRLDLLRVAGAETARVIVVAVDDMATSLEIVELVRALPQAKIVARRATSRTTSSCASRPDPHRARDLRRRPAQRPQRARTHRHGPTPRASTRCASASTTSSCWRPRCHCNATRPPRRRRQGRAASSLNNCWPWSARPRRPGMPRRVRDGTTRSSAPPGDGQQTPRSAETGLSGSAAGSRWHVVKPFAHLLTGDLHHVHHLCRAASRTCASASPR